MQAIAEAPICQRHNSKPKPHQIGKGARIHQTLAAANKHIHNQNVEENFDYVWRGQQ